MGWSQGTLESHATLVENLLEERREEMQSMPLEIRVEERGGDEMGRTGPSVQRERDGEGFAFNKGI